MERNPKLDLKTVESTLLESKDVLLSTRFPKEKLLLLLETLVPLNKPGKMPKTQLLPLRNEKAL